MKLTSFKVKFTHTWKLGKISFQLNGGVYHTNFKTFPYKDHSLNTYNFCLVNFFTINNTHVYYNKNHYTSENLIIRLNDRLWTWKSTLQFFGTTTVVLWKNYTQQISGEHMVFTFFHVVVIPSSASSIGFRSPLSFTLQGPCSN